LGLACWILIGAAILIGSKPNKAYSNLEKWIRKYGLLTIIGGVLFLVFWSEFLAGPSHAFFFESAEKFLVSKLVFAKGGAAKIGTFVSLIFNVLRALLIIYVGVAMVRIVTALRDDDDWRAIARTPMIVVLVVMMSDALREHPIFAETLNCEQPIKVSTTI
jgi:hypothetical protein